MATNQSPWKSNVDGSEKPLRQQLNVALGSTRAINRGEICYLESDAVGNDMVPVSAATDNLHALFIADEEQLATDPARFMWFIIPRDGDVFEFALDAATAIDWGDELQISDSQTLKKSSTDPVAAAVDVPYEDAGVTSPSLSRVRATFKRAGAGNVDLPYLTTFIGDAS